MKSLLDPSFVYTPSHATDIRATFARVREEQRIDSERKRAAESLQTRRVINVFDRRREAAEAATRG